MKEPHELISSTYALRNKVLPLSYSDSSVKVAAISGDDVNMMNELRFILGRELELEIWEEARLIKELAQVYGAAEGDSKDDEPQYEFIEKRQESLQKKRTAEDQDDSVVLIVNQFISDAIRKKASDIHVESYENDFRIRYRLDGKLVEYLRPPIQKSQAIVSRLKIMADMDIAEKRRPQDGRIRMKNGKKSVDIRVSSLPTDFGEKIVLRILDKSSLKLSLEALGFEGDKLQNFKKVLKIPYGMVLVTGPTGSGKTTTLYSALNYINNPDVNVITIEDPIEYNLNGVNQTMVKANIGLTFANILRTILRQDPNIIMVGEIRDSETAEIAVRAALTGHLVLSTLHTNDAISTIVRLVDMGIEPFLIAQSVKMVVAQRLVRKICPHCKRESGIEWNNYQDYPIPETLKSQSFYEGAGCPECNSTGFSGREAILEQVMIDDDFVDLILRRAGIDEFRKLAKSKSINNLFETGLNRALEGNTSLQEVLRETFVF